MHSLAVLDSTQLSQHCTVLRLMILLAISRCQGSNLQLMCPLYYREPSWSTLYFKKVCAMAGLEPAITGMGKFYVRRLDHSAKLLCYSETSTFAYIKCCIHFYCILQTSHVPWLQNVKEKQFLLLINSQPKTQNFPV